MRPWPLLYEFSSQVLEGCASNFAVLGESISMLSDPLVEEVREYAIIKGLSAKDIETIESEIKFYFYARPTLRYKVNSKYFALSSTDVFQTEVRWGSQKQLSNLSCSNIKEKFEVMGAIKVSKIKKKIDELSYKMPRGFGAAPAQDDSYRGNQKDFIDKLFSAPAGSQVQDA